MSHALPLLSPEPSRVLDVLGPVLGDRRRRGTGDPQEFCDPRGAAWVPSHADWLITTEFGNDRLKITDVRTGQLVCKFGQQGEGDGQFNG